MKHCRRHVGVFLFYIVYFRPFSESVRHPYWCVMPPLVDKKFSSACWTVDWPVFFLFSMLHQELVPFDASRKAACFHGAPPPNSATSGEQYTVNTGNKGQRRCCTPASRICAAAAYNEFGPFTMWLLVFTRLVKRPRSASLLQPP